MKLLLRGEILFIDENWATSETIPQAFDSHSPFTLNIQLCLVEFSPGSD